MRKAGYTAARSIIRRILQSSALRYELGWFGSAFYDDVADLAAGTLIAGLPVFASRMRGACDLSRNSP
jgi:hypothetical protein